MTMESMLAQAIQRRELQTSPFASSPVHSAQLEDYLTEHLGSHGSSSSTTDLEVSARRSLEDAGGYVPSFEGYLNLGFSVHVPCDHTTLLDCRLNIDDYGQGRLESLVMLFLCSQGVELVISTAPTTLLHVCPFNGNDDSRGGTTTATKALKNADNALIGDLGGNPMIAWNLPRFESETIPFGGPSAETSKETIIDMATNTTFILTNGPPQQYYTQLTFTYPVYQWGAEDPSVEALLQDEFDTSVISTGTLDSLLPWQNSVASPIGEEPYVFWNEPRPVVGFFDTNIPRGAGDLLQWIGSGLVIFNTVGIVLLSLAARKKKRSDQQRFARSVDEPKDAFRNKEYDSQNSYSSGGAKQGMHMGLQPSDYLDTEAGVSAILMESKQYALTKGQSFLAANLAARQKEKMERRAAKAASKSSKTRNGPVTTADSNIQGVEVDLKMVDVSHPMRHHHIKKQSNSSRSLPKKSPEEKEDVLLARAKIQRGYNSEVGGYNGYGANDNSTQWYSGDKLLDTDDEDADDRAAENDDLQILDVSSPSSGENLNLSF
jgi:hypothetical protein